MRPPWDKYFLDMLPQIASRATCDRGKCASIITKDNRILSTGYVGAPPGLPHCDDVGHDIHKVEYPDGNNRDHCYRTTHAELNAILHAARHGIKLEGSTMYSTMSSCRNCASAIASVGIVRVVSLHRYQADQHSEEIFSKNNIEVSIINDKVLEY